MKENGDVINFKTNESARGNFKFPKLLYISINLFLGSDILS